MAERSRASISCRDLVRCSSSVRVRFGLVEGRGHLERGRGEAREALQDARILCIEPSLGCVPDGPEGADRLVLHMPGGEQVLVDAWLDTPEGSERTAPPR